jgi:hypothetical protein
MTDSFTGQVIATRDSSTLALQQNLRRIIGYAG